MAKIIKLRSPIRKFSVAVWVYSRGGGLLTIKSYRVGAYLKGGFFGGGGNSRIYGILFLALTVKLNLANRAVEFFPYCNGVFYAEGPPTGTNVTITKGIDPEMPDLLPMPLTSLSFAYILVEASQVYHITTETQSITSKLTSSLLPAWHSFQCSSKSTPWRDFLRLLNQNALARLFRQ